MSAGKFMLGQRSYRRAREEMLLLFLMSTRGHKKVPLDLLWNEELTKKGKHNTNIKLGYHNYYYSTTARTTLE